MSIPPLTFQDFGKNIQGSWKYLNQCNILVVGNTGVGKTTLVGSILNLPDDNQITTSIKPHQNKRISNLTLYDTPGFERKTKSFWGKNKQKNNKQNILDFVKSQKAEDKEPEEHIHMVWYCFSAQTTRDSEIDTDFIKKVGDQQIPIALVRTRSYDTNTKKEVPLPIVELEYILPVKELVLVLAKLESVIGGGKIDSFGLDVLQEVTEECLNDIAEKAFIDSVKAKKDKAIKFLTAPIIGIATAQGLIPPIPFFKSSVIVSSQAFLAKKIANIFGYQAKFSDSDIKDYLAITSITEILNIDEVLQNFNDYFYKNLPSLNEDTGVIEALKTLSSWMSNSADAVKTIPFQEELGKVILNIAKILEESPTVFMLEEIPFLSILTSLTTLITTLIFALVWIEALREIKIREYKGENIPAEKVKEIIEDIIEDINQRFIGFNLAT